MRREGPTLIERPRSIQATESVAAAARFHPTGPMAAAAAQFHFELALIDPLEYDYSPSSVVVGDVTGDGRPDVVASLYDVNRTHPYIVRIHEQSPSGALKEPIQVALQFTDYVNSIGIELADLDGNGVKEIVVGNDGPDGGLMVIAKTGNRFLVTAEYPGMAKGTFLAPVDIDGSGHLDIFAQGWEYGADIFIGNGRGVFSRVDHLNTSYAGYPTVEASDFTADGLADVLVQTGDIVRVYPSGHGPELQSPFVINLAPFVPYEASGMTVADMDQDGRPDLVITDQGDRGIPLPSGVRILYRGAGNSFSRMQFLVTTGQEPNDPWGTDTPSAIRVADIDGNGYPDIITMFGGWRRMGYFLQGPTGFDPLVTMEIQPNPWWNNPYFDNSFDVADINSDGCPDVVIADLSSSLRVFYGRNCQPRAKYTGGRLLPRRR